MRPYGEFCPISKAAELLGERWTTQVVRELFCGSNRFSELQSGIPGVPKSLRGTALPFRLVLLERE